MKLRALLVTAAASVADASCEFSLEVLQIQDASGSFANYITAMETVTVDLTNALRAKYADFRFGVAGFIDKPLPFRGLGNYAGSKYYADWCYQLFTPLTDNEADIKKALAELHRNMGSGGDLPENPLEAMIFGALDSMAGWSDPYTEDGMTKVSNTVRLLLVVTDDKAHQPTDASDGTARGWNWPRSYPAGELGDSTGGFGAHSFKTSNLFTSADTANYYVMCDLFSKYDHGTITDEEQAELLDWIEYFGPYPWPALKPFPGDNSEPDCALTEYPSIEQVAWVLKERNILPVFLVPRGSTVLHEYYVDLVRQMGIMGVVAPMDLDTVLENIVEAIETLTQAVCSAPTTTPHPKPTSTSTTSTTTTTEFPIIVPTRPITSVVTTELLESSATETISQETEITTTLEDDIFPPVIIPPGEDGDTDAATDEAGTTTTGDDPIIIPPVIPGAESAGGGTSAGVIAGAVSGSVVGAAAIGAGIYYGAGHLLQTPTFEDLPAGDLAPDAMPDIMERDGRVELTNDMFS
eukprot:Blabericola_migrator_1__648@NODE_115_length_13846_cov_473_148632_g103_i0_p2_GENE_NODE_115_length_13846_cov_473_148632_g103_i0NODE_115_length_13846_cov_473_148632_g103_i0_p2_ORF_typecomplete_len522_score77_27Integrin_beta/PF00362_18/1_2e14Integrin_beta/PF00362_18/7_1e05VWA_2/PF13519_6/0_18PII/PF00543_22/6_4e02PII/PF00543_22/4_1PII/PF00543_22/1_7e04_NODE_115_length_13846_cov_473_148632_g103_i025704135